MGHIGKIVERLYNEGKTDQEIIDHFEIWREKGFAQMELRGLKNRLARSKSKPTGIPTDTTTTTSDGDNDP